MHKTYRRIQITIATCLVWLILFTIGCKPVKSTQATPSLDVPAGFAGYGDTASKMLLSKDKIFTDPNLVDLVELAIKQNPDLQMAIQRIEVAKSYLRFRNGAMLPTVDVDVTAAARRYGDYTMEGIGNKESGQSGSQIPTPVTPDYFLGLRSTWEVDLWGKLKNRKHAAYNRLLSSWQGKNLVITTLVAEVANRYYELLAYDTELEIIRKNIALQENAVEIAKVQKEGGRATELSIQQFNAQLLRTQSLLVKTEQSIIRVENELNYLLGRFPQPVKRNGGFMQSPVPSNIMAGLPNEILNRRPDVLQAELELKANKADVAAAKAAFLPALTVAPYVGYNSFNTSFLFNPGSLVYGVIGGLTTPLINRSALKSDYSRAEAEKMQAYYQYNKTVLNAFQEVQTTLGSLENLQRIYNLNDEEARVLTNAINTSNELFKVGYANYLEVITAQKNAIEAELNLIETKRNLFYALVNLYRSTGGGW